MASPKSWICDTADNFITATAEDAQSWTEKIKSCLLDS